MFEKLSGSLMGFFGGLRGKRLTEKNIREGLGKIRTELLEADVNVKVVRAFLKAVTEKAVGEHILKSLRPEEEIAKIVYEELLHLMGEEDSDIAFSDTPPTVILMAGLQGSGKTTTCGKLAVHLKTLGKRPMLVAADVQRPAAIQQLRVVAGQVEVPVHAEDDTKDVVAICKRGVAAATENDCDVVILDTAGRLHIDDDLMGELRAVHAATKPHQVFLVCDGLTGQDAVRSAKRFNEDLEIDGVILTKMDGDSRGGAALSIRYITKKPIKFLGTGEKFDRLERFRPEGMASRIIGEGDLQALIERAQSVYDQQEAEDLQRAMLENKFTLDHFRTSLQQMKKLGSFKDILAMLPGAGQLSELEVDDKEIDRVEAILNSMTPKERQLPQIIGPSRQKRIASGSGTSQADVIDLLKQFKQMRKFMKNMGPMMAMMGAGGGGGGGMMPDLGSMLGMGGGGAPQKKQRNRPKRGRRR